MKLRMITIALGLAGVIAATSPNSFHAQESESGEDRQIHLRAEFYDVPASEALRIQQEFAGETNHDRAREEILAMVKTGDAAFVTSAPLTARPGYRAKFEDTVTVQAVENFTWDEESRQLVPDFGNHEVGTIFEVDPTLSPDGKAIGLNFALEHHTGEPVIETLLVPVGDTADSREVSVTRFHRKKITTRIYLEGGSSRLVGAFEITGLPASSPENPVADGKRLVFICADIEKANETE